MNDKTPIDAALLHAFRRTRYRVFTPDGELDLHIDQYDAALSRLLHARNCISAALLTAWNPGAEPTAIARNESLQQQLVAAMVGEGYACLDAVNEPFDDATDSRVWREPSVLVLGITLRQSHHAAVRFGQLGFVWMDRQATPRLMLAESAQS